MRQRNAAVLAVTLAAVLIEIALWSVSGLWRTSRGFLHATFEAYALVFFSLLVLATFAYVHRNAGSGALRRAALGMATGYATSILAVNIATLLLPDGLQRLEGSLRGVGLTSLVVTQLLFPVALGGWLFGAVAFWLAPAVLARASRRD